jgi:hypothetical protein
LAVSAVPSLSPKVLAALALAELILRGTSITTRRGEVASAAFVFDMNKVFEDFLSAALRTALERRGGRVRLQYAQRHLDEASRLKLKPDIYHSAPPQPERWCCSVERWDAFADAVQLKQEDRRHAFPQRLARRDSQ